MTKTTKLSPWAELRAILREILRALKEMATSDRLAYSVPELAARCGLSDQQIYEHIARRDLTPKYSGTKMLIPVQEAERFIAELPEENHGALR